jgi:hypothetical protein
MGELAAGIVSNIQVAEFLIQLGVVTVEKVKEVFRGQGHDDEVLAQIDAELDRRLARRS